MKEMERFGGDRLIDEGKIEEFVFGISMIFRKFLSAAVPLRRDGDDHL